MRQEGQTDTTIPELRDPLGKLLQEGLFPPSYLRMEQEGAMSGARHRPHQNECTGSIVVCLTSELCTRNVYYIPIM